MENENVEVDTLSADLAAAWEASEGDDNGTELKGGTIPESSVEPSNTSGFSSSNNEDNTGQPATDDTTVLSDTDSPDGVNKQPEENEKPPVGLSPEAREEWGNTPDAVKEAIVKREADYERGIMHYSQNAKRAEAMDRSLQPYQQYMQMNGGPKEAIQSLLQTGSSLQMGSAIQKAQILAGLIQQFGVDVKTLDSMLVGEAPSAESQQQENFNQQLSQHLAPMQQQLQYYQQRDQQQANQYQNQVSQEVNSFGAKNEFYADVRADMADLMDMAANRGRPMDMDEAYKIACSNHPQISSIVSGRTSQDTVNKKRQAASSISGSPGGSGGIPIGGTMTEDLNIAWDSAGQM